MAIYLDHSATTPVSTNVIDAIQPVLNEHYGNPSSLHRMGLNAEKFLKQARVNIAKMLNVKEKQVIFTSGGTEANNLAIFGSLRKERGRIITTAFEHASVLSTMEHLKKDGYELIYLPIGSQGHINIEDLSNALTDDTQLVSIMYVNNEVGSVMPIETIGKIIHEFNLKNKAHIKFHVDAVQAFGKIKIDMTAMKIDLMSISGHKINALKGTGALIKGNDIDIKPRVFGGGQENGIRPGTENVVGIVAMGQAALDAEAGLTSHAAHVKWLKDTLVSALTDIDGIYINGAGNQSPYVLNVSFEGIKAEVMLHTLEMSKIYVSTGSACHSKKKSQSHVLTSMGLPDSRIEGAIRISFGAVNTIDEIEIATKAIIKAYSDLSKIMKRR